MYSGMYLNATQDYSVPISLAQIFWDLTEDSYEIVS